MTTGRIERTEEEQKKRPLNRLQTIYALRAQQDEDFKNRQKSAKEEGKPVAWCAPDSFYRHVFKAMGVDEIYTDSYAPTLAASGTAPFFLDRCDAEGFPSHMCGYYRVMLGYAIRMAELGGQIPPEAPPGRGIPKPNLIVSELRVCDAHAKGMRAIGRFMDAPQWIEESGPDRWQHTLDKEVYEADVRLMVTELKDFVSWLERLFGKKCDWDVFEADIEGNRDMQKIWSWISNEARKVRPCPVNIRDQLTGITGALFKTPDIEKTTKMYSNIRDEVQHRIDNKISGINKPEKYRLVQGGIPPYHSLNLFEQLADRGWNFVRGGYNAQQPVDVSWVKDPAEKAVRYHRRFLGDEIDRDFEPAEAARIKRQLETEGFSNELSAHDAKVYQADGVFAVPLRTCRGSNLNYVFQRYSYMEAYKVPVLTIPGDHIDQRLFDPVDALNKLIAFEETMDYYKEVRKKEGLGW